MRLLWLNIDVHRPYYVSCIPLPDDAWIDRSYNRTDVSHLPWQEVVQTSLDCNRIDCDWRLPSRLCFS